MMMIAMDEYMDKKIHWNIDFLYIRTDVSVVVVDFFNHSSGVYYKERDSF